VSSEVISIGAFRGLHVAMIFLGKQSRDVLFTVEVNRGKFPNRVVSHAMHVMNCLL